MPVFEKSARCPSCQSNHSDRCKDVTPEGEQCTRGSPSWYIATWREGSVCCDDQGHNYTVARILRAVRMPAILDDTVDVSVHPDSVLAETLTEKAS